MTTAVRESEPDIHPDEVESSGRSETSSAPRAPRPGPSLKSVLIPLGVLVVGAGAVAIVALYPVAPADLDEGTGPPAVDVKVETISAIAQRDEIRLPGVLEPFRTVRVAAEVPGRIEKVCATEGDDVEANQELAMLNTDLLDAVRDQVLAKHELDKRELNRYEGLEKRGVATEIEMFRARAAVAISRANLTEVSERLKRAVIRSPMRCVLNDMLVEPGEFVAAGTPVAELMDVDRLKVVVNLPERDVVHVRVGQKVQVLVDAIDGYELTDCKVTFISARGDEKCRTFRTEIVAGNESRRVRAGLIVRVVLLRRTIEEAIMIPLVSVIPTENGYQVYVARDGKAVARKLEIGMLVGDRVQAKTGLKAGDMLIVDGHRLASDGGPVNVVE